MKHVLRAQSFTLELEVEILDADLALPVPVNMLLYVRVSSDGFGAVTYMDVEAEQFARFCCDLYQLYAELRGAANIHEVFVEENHIEFTGDRDGHISVSGCLNNHWRDGMEQELRFENTFDQTYLRGFATELYRTYRRYLRAE